MQDFRADMHTHTTCSDGSMTPEGVVRLAAAHGLNALSITDHDTIDAYPDILPIAKEAGIEMVSGVEFSTMHKNISVHVLAYGFATNSPAIQAFCTRHQQRREQRSLEMLHLLAKHGMPVSEEELFANRPSKRGIGRPHIAQAMVAKGYVKDIVEAFKKHLGEGRPCYTSGKPCSVEETLDCIRQANGYAILAHPHLVNNPPTLNYLLTLPFDGIECHYARFNRDQNKRWLNIAKKKEWLELGGSDFHGDIKPTIPLGCSWIGEDTFRVLRQRFMQNQESLT